MARTTACTVVLTLAASAALGGALGAVAVRQGWAEIAADVPHLQPVYDVLEIAFREGVRRRARHIEERPLDSAGLLARGTACFQAHCVVCHGAPGTPPAPAGLAMQPLPGPLTDAARHWRPRELVWILRHGVRMSGMPAWGGWLADDDLWAITAVLLELPALSPDAWRRLAAVSAPASCPARGSDALPGGTAAAGRDAGRDGERVAPPLGQSVAGPGVAINAALHTDADATATADVIFDDTPSAVRRRALRAIRRHGCTGCHVIPGTVGSDRHVGPPLAGFGRRSHLAGGRLPNSAGNLARWIREPQVIDPQTAMPATGVGTADAQAIAAYLLSLR